MDVDPTGLAPKILEVGYVMVGIPAPVPSRFVLALVWEYPTRKYIRATAVPTVAGLKLIPIWHGVDGQDVGPTTEKDVVNELMPTTEAGPP